MSIASFTVEISAIEPEVMAAFARTLDPDLDPDVDQAVIVEEILVNPPQAPLDAGYEIRAKTVRDIGLGRFMLDLEAEILDETQFLTAARFAYGNAWSEKFEPDNLGHALYELVVASNASPSPVEIGFEIVTYDYRGEPVAPSPQAP